NGCLPVNAVSRSFSRCGCAKSEVQSFSLSGVTAGLKGTTMRRYLWLVGALLLTESTLLQAAQPSAEKPLSHPPLRPLPELSKRALGRDPSHFVDPAKGKDDAAGSEKAPWRTINHALKQLSPGDTLYLRGGTYREHVYCAVAGKPDSPITIRAYPGERVIVDG